MAIGRKVLKKRANAKKFTFKYEGVATAAAGAKGKYYPAEDAAVAKGPVPVRNAPRLKKGVTPGTVLVLLAGRFRGKRVVCLKQLESGLLLVTGPYAVNGVPLRRVNQKYVIATSTKVDLAGVNVANINDKTFARTSKDISKGPSASRAELQKTVDTALSAALKKTPLLENYIKSKFSLSNSDKPHAMKF